MQGLQVSKEKAESARKTLIALGALDFTKKILRNEKSVIFPIKITKKITNPAISSLGKKTSANFEGIAQKPDSIEDALCTSIPAKALGNIAKSFDIVGDIAIIELEKKHSKYAKKIAKAIFQVHKNVKVVLKKASAMQGVFRTRKLTYIAGEKRTCTLYRENGVPMYVDLAKMYFSTRLATERLRIASFVNPGESVLVMFAGCGPFALVCAKRQPSAKILGVEINPEAVKYFNANIKLNKFQNVKAICADVRKFLGKNHENKYDRIVMPLPKDAEHFLNIAITCAKNAATIHLYSFVKIEDGFEIPLQKIRQECTHQGRKFKIISSRVVRPYSPKTQQVVIDFRVF